MAGRAAFTISFLDRYALRRLAPTPAMQGYWGHPRKAADCVPWRRYGGNREVVRGFMGSDGVFWRRVPAPRR